jgi:hypothetical protein
LVADAAVKRVAKECAPDGEYSAFAIEHYLQTDATQLSIYSVFVGCIKEVLMGADTTTKRVRRAESLARIAHNAAIAQGKSAHQARHAYRQALEKHLKSQTDESV